MHPLVAHIHPSYRSAFFAFIVGRSALYIAMHAIGQAPLDVESSGGLLADWFGVVVEIANAHVESVDNAGDWLGLIVNEIAVFVGLVGLYRFVRRDAMPQGADRAVWLAACSPLMVLTLPGSDWAMVFAIAMWSLELAGAGLGVWAALLFSLGVVTRPDLLVLWPGFAALIWRMGSNDDLSTWFAGLLPLLAFASRVLWAVLFGDPNTLYTYEAAWRTDLVWSGWHAHLADLGVLGVSVFGLALAAVYWRRRPKSWVVMAVPCLIWPVLHEPSTAAVGTMLVCAASFGHLGAYTEDPGHERLVLGLSLVGLVALALL